MTQESLDFGLLFRVREARRRIVRECNDVVDMIGLSIVAGALDMRRQDLRDALDGRNDRKLDLEVALLIAAHRSCPAENRRRILPPELIRDEDDAKERSRAAAADARTKIRKDLGITVQ